MKTRRVVLRFLLFIALLVTLLYAYLQVGFLPGRLKTFVIQKTEELTGEKVVFDKALYIPFRGLIFSDFKVVRSLDGRTLFAAKTLALDVRVLPFLKEKKLVVRNVFLDSPVYSWVLKDTAAQLAAKPPPPPKKTKISGQIVVPAVPEDSTPDLAKLSDGPDAFLPENVYLEQFEITNGLVSVREIPSGPLVEEMTAVNLKLAFQHPPILHLEGSMSLGSTSYGALTFHGGWDLEKANYDFYLKTSARRLPDWIVRYQSRNALILQKGILGLEGRLTNAPGTEKKSLFHVKTSLSDASLAAGGARIAGRTELDARGIFDFEKKSISRYQGSLQFSEGSVTGLPGGFHDLEGLSGSLRFKPELVRIESLSGSYRHLVIEGEGALQSFSRLMFDANLRTHATLTDLLELLPENQKKFLEGWNLNGLCEAALILKGSLKEPAAIRWDALLDLKDGTAKNAAKKIELTDITSEISANAAEVRIVTGHLTAAKKKYAVEGAIPLHPETKADLLVRSSELDLNAVYSWKQNAFDIHSAKISYEGFNGDFHGSGIGLDRPLFDLKGDFRINLERLAPQILPYAPALKDLGLKGDLHGRYLLKGYADAPLDWDLKLDARSDVLHVKEKFRIDDLEAQVRMKNRILNIPYLHAKPYGGSGGFRSSFDLSKPEIPFDGKIYVNDLDLTLLAKDLDPKMKDLAGKLNLLTLLKGKLKSQDTFQGSGKINIREGYIWKTDLFKDMGNLVIVKVIGLDQVVFHALNANFKIADKKVITQDLTLDSDTVHLVFKGRVGFDQTLDFIMWIRYSDAILRGAADTGGIAPFVIDKAEQFISQYKISGTLQSPKNEKLLAPPV